MPQIFRFGGINYDLLMAVYGQLPEKSRQDLIVHLLLRVERGGTYVFPNPEDYSFPSFANNVSELPLVAEFSIRTGHGGTVFPCNGKSKGPDEIASDHDDPVGRDICSAVESL